MELKSCRHTDMDNVNDPIVPPEDDISYIPTIQHSSSSVEAGVPTVRYPPASVNSSSSIPLLSSSRTILASAGAADSTPFIQGAFQYRATLVQQVHFQYPTPPTPPVEGCCSSPEGADKPIHTGVQSSMPENLAMTQGAMEGDAGKPVNPFPSLPTPPDVQDLQQEHQHHMQLSSMVSPQPGIYSKPMHTTRFRMPPFNDGMSMAMFNKSPGSLQQPMFCYPAAPIGDTKMMMSTIPSPRGGHPPIPPLLKDGEGRLPCLPVLSTCASLP